MSGVWKKTAKILAILSFDMISYSEKNTDQIDI